MDELLLLYRYTLPHTKLRNQRYHQHNTSLQDMQYNLRQLLYL